MLSETVCAVTLSRVSAGLYNLELCSSTGLKIRDIVSAGWGVLGMLPEIHKICHDLRDKHIVFSNHPLSRCTGGRGGEQGTIWKLRCLMLVDWEDSEELVSTK